MKNITFFLDEKLKKDFQRACFDNDTDISKVLREFIQRYIRQGNPRFKA